MTLPGVARNVAARRHHRQRPQGRRRGSRGTPLPVIALLLAAIVLPLVAALLVLLAVQRAMADIPATSVGVERSGGYTRFGGCRKPAAAARTHPHPPVR